MRARRYLRRVKQNVLPENYPECFEWACTFSCTHLRGVRGHTRVIVEARGCFGCSALATSFFCLFVFVWLWRSGHWLARIHHVSWIGKPASSRDPPVSTSTQRCGYIRFPTHSRRELKFSNALPTELSPVLGVPHSACKLRSLSSLPRHRSAQHGP